MQVPNYFPTGIPEVERLAFLRDQYKGDKVPGRGNSPPVEIKFEHALIFSPKNCGGVGGVACTRTGVFHVHGRSRPAGRGGRFCESYHRASRERERDAHGPSL